MTEIKLIIYNKNKIRYKLYYTCIIISTSNRLYKYRNLTYNLIYNNNILIFIHTTLKARAITSGTTYS